MEGPYSGEMFNEFSTKGSKGIGQGSEGSYSLFLVLDFVCGLIKT
jgi:hypothetical protein